MNLDDILPQQVSAPQTKRDWSDMQLAIFERQSQSPANLIIEAKAGSGKTTLLVELMKRAGGKTIFLAFNKSIADELKSRVSGGDVKTLNGLGHGLMRQHRPGAKLEKWKTFAYLRQKMSADLYEACGKELVRAVGIAKGLAFGIDGPCTEARMLGVIDSYGLTIPSELLPSAAKMATKAFHDLTSDETSAEFDFDDQLYVPIKENWTFPRYDTVYVDEAQDLNPIQHCILGRLASRGARIIAVGDRNQAIYGFRGALTNSMDVLSGNFSMEELPLSITYRCAQAIVTRAQEIVPGILARPGAPEGSVSEAGEYPEVNAYGNGALVICRNNAPIFELALQFLKARLPCRVMSNFMDEMDKFIESFKALDTVTLIDRLDAWYAKQKADCENRCAWGKLEGVEDRYQVVRRFAQEFKVTKDLLRAVSALASSSEGPRISTIHKAKGLEAERVYLLRWDLLPSARATMPEQVVQEHNLQYVAITRAKNELIILPKEEGT